MENYSSHVAAFIQVNFQHLFLETFVCDLDTIVSTVFIKLVKPEVPEIVRQLPVDFLRIPYQAHLRSHCTVGHTVLFKGNAAGYEAFKETE